MSGQSFLLIRATRAGAAQNSALDSAEQGGLPARWLHGGVSSPDLGGGHSSIQAFSDPRPWTGVGQSFLITGVLWGGGLLSGTELSSGKWRGHASPFPREMLTPHPPSHHGVGRCWVCLTSVPHFYPFPEIRAKFQGGLEEDKENWEESVKIKENLTEVESGG